MRMINIYISNLQFIQLIFQSGSKDGMEIHII